MIIAATGHRPNKLGGYTRHSWARLLKLAEWYIAQQIKVGLKEGISGLALGWDMAWAVGLIRASIPLVAAVPFRGQEDRWPDDSKRMYRKIIGKAAHVEIVCPGGYSDEKYQTRNEWMVDRCDELAALWNGSDGGTANCIAYAQLVGRPYENLWSYWQALQQVPFTIK